MSSKNAGEKWDSELDKYSQKVVPIFLQKLKHDEFRYETILKKLFDLYILHSFIVEEKLSGKPYNSIMLLFGKSAHSVFGIYTCLKNGLVSEAAILIRNVFELYVNTKLILENDVDERIKLWYNFRFVTEWKNYKSNLNLLEKEKLEPNRFEKTFSAGFIKEITNNYEKVKNDYHPEYPNHWAWKIFKEKYKGKNPNLKKICDHLSLEFDYIKIYSSLSTTVHVNPLLSNLISENRNISVAPFFSDKIPLLIKLTVGYTSEIIELIIKYIDAKLGEELSTYLSYYKYNVYNNL